MEENLQHKKSSFELENDNLKETIERFTFENNCLKQTIKELVEANILFKSTAAWLDYKLKKLPIKNEPESHKENILNQSSEEDYVKDTVL